MDPVTFWKHYGRELEEILNYAHKMEADRLARIIEKGNHYQLADEKYDFERFIRLRMIEGVVINMNRDEKVDSQKPVQPK